MARAIALAQPCGPRTMTGGCRRLRDQGEEFLARHADAALGAFGTESLGKHGAEPVSRHSQGLQARGQAATKRGQLLQSDLVVGDDSGVGHGMQEVDEGGLLHPVG